ncbi:hypothetical protein [Persephonella sp.]
MVYRQFLPRDFREEGKVYVAVVGDMVNKEIFDEKMEIFLSYEGISPEDIVFIGAGYKIDKIAKQWIEERGGKMVHVVPDKEKYGEKAPIMRLRHIVKSSDILLMIRKENSRIFSFLKNVARDNEKKFYAFKAGITENGPVLSL